MAPSPSTKIINRTAAATLEPLGLKKHGSRLWLADHGWWLVGVALDSPAYAQGLRPTLFADFLWSGSDDVAFSVRAPLDIPRPEFTPMHLRGCDWDDDPANFAACCAASLDGIAAEIVTWKRDLPTLAAWAEYLGRYATTNRHGRVNWSRYDHAVAAALTGDPRSCRAALATLARDYAGDDVDFVQALLREIPILIALLDDGDAFATEMRARTTQRRRLLTLPDHALDLPPTVRRARWSWRRR